MKFIKVQGKTYTLLGLNDGNVSLGLKFDLNNEVVKNGVIWDMQPWKYRSKLYCVLNNFIRSILNLYTWHSDWVTKIHNRSQLKIKLYSNEKIK